MSGRVESVNVGIARPEPAAHYRGGETAIDKRPTAAPVLLGVSGVEGDTICDLEHHGGPDQAVYAYSAEDLAFWAAELGQPVAPGGVGENLTLSGVDCSGAVVGERWRAGDAVLVVRAPRIPCRVFAAFRGVPDLVKRFIWAGRPGSYLAVEHPAPVTAGDAVHVLDRPAHGVTVADVMAAMTIDRAREGKVATAREHMSARGRQWLDRRAGHPREE